MDPDPVLNAFDIVSKEKQPFDVVIKNYLQPYFLSVTRENNLFWQIAHFEK
jgi:hypothetical protein